MASRGVTTSIPRTGWLVVLAAWVVLISSIGTPVPAAWAKSCDGVAVPCRVGDIGPGGGVVFYDAGSVQPWGRYLEAAPAGWWAAAVQPSVPRRVKAKGIQGGVRVTWRKPSSGGGVTYLVSTIPESKGCQTSKTSCRVRGLTAGESYEVSVVARNAAGASAAVTVSARVPKRRAPTRPAPTRPVPAPSEKPKPEYRSLPGKQLPRSTFPPDPRAVWCPSESPNYNTALETGTAIGTGRTNTALIIQACGTNTAAGLAAGYRGGGNSDWFLPSKDELAALVKERRVVGDVAAGDFWTSSEDERTNYPRFVFYIYSITRYQPASSKGIEHQVRPVRAF